ncbi:uncharacterized protein LOC141665454 [Apium graveolens]|uniref:uncharacterized protein LOC141665454 n=1 Tax=Apium graveolens TaxID=4045 RepID=UPI003D7AE10E
MASYGAATIGNTSNTSGAFSSIVSSVIDTNHPYFLQTSDNPGIPLVTQPLTERNYYHRSRSIRIALPAKMKLGMIDETLPKPASTSIPYALWSRCNDMVLTCAKKLETYVDMIKLSQFLMGINDQYTSVRGQLLMMQLVPSISQAFSLLLQEESQREFSKMSQSPLTDNMALTVDYNNLAKFKSSQTSTASKKSATDVTCDYCHTDGHVRDKWFCLHGYPDWHKFYGKPKPNPRKSFNSSSTTTPHRTAAQVSNYPANASSSEHNV